MTPFRGNSLECIENLKTHFINNFKDDDGGGSGGVIIYYLHCNMLNNSKRFIFMTIKDLNSFDKFIENYNGQPILSVSDKGFNTQKWNGNITEDNFKWIVPENKGDSAK